ncbi:hypothetical protein DFH27DRAFT_527758 [Peziza echinospora]|nr:hypothetical protein DFH27DRAFT_527758 [Peziza echinospora]
MPAPTGQIDRHVVLPIGQQRPPCLTTTRPPLESSLTIRPHPQPSSPVEPVASPSAYDHPQDRICIAISDNISSVQLNEYTIPADGIRWDVIDRTISALLGEEAYMWKTYSRTTSSTGSFTMYSTGPLTQSQIEDLQRWSAVANAEDRERDRITPGSTPEQKEARRLERLEHIQRSRAESEERDRIRFQREKQRRLIEREAAWEERRKEEAKRRWMERELEHDHCFQLHHGQSRSAAENLMMLDDDDKEEPVSQRKRKRAMFSSTEDYDDDTTNTSTTVNFHTANISTNTTSHRKKRSLKRPASTSRPGKRGHDSRKEKQKQKPQLQRDELVDICADWDNMSQLATKEDVHKLLLQFYRKKMRADARS